MKKKSQLILSLAVLTLFLAACGTSPVTESSTGFWDRIVLYNFCLLYTSDAADE